MSNVTVVTRRNEISLSNRESAAYFGFSIKGIKVGDVAFHTTDEEEIKYFIENKVSGKYQEAVKLLSGWLNMKSYKAVGLKIIADKKYNNGFGFYVEFIFEVEEVKEVEECDLSKIKTRKGIADKLTKDFNIDFSFIKYENFGGVKSFGKAYLKNKELKIEGFYQGISEMKSCLIIINL